MKALTTTFVLTAFHLFFSLTPSNPSLYAQCAKEHDRGRYLGVHGPNNDVKIDGCAQYAALAGFQYVQYRVVNLSNKKIEVTLTKTATLVCGEKIAEEETIRLNPGQSRPKNGFASPLTSYELHISHQPVKECAEKVINHRTGKKTSYNAIRTFGVTNVRVVYKDTPGSSNSAGTNATGENREEERLALEQKEKERREREREQREKEQRELEEQKKKAFDQHVFAAQQAELKLHHAEALYQYQQALQLYPENTFVKKKVVGMELDKSWHPEKYAVRTPSNSAASNANIGSDPTDPCDCTKHHLVLEYKGLAEQHDNYTFCNVQRAVYAVSACAYNCTAFDEATRNKWLLTAIESRKRAVYYTGCDVSAVESTFPIDASMLHNTDVGTMQEVGNPGFNLENDSPEQALIQLEELIENPEVAMVVGIIGATWTIAQEIAQLNSGNAIIKQKAKANLGYNKLDFLPNNTVQVKNLSLNGASRMAGLKENDIILDINNQNILLDKSNFRNTVANHESGDTLNMSVLRSSERLEVPVVLGNPPLNQTPQARALFIQGKNDARKNFKGGKHFGKQFGKALIPGIGLFMFPDGNRSPSIEDLNIPDMSLASNYDYMSGYGEIAEYRYLTNRGLGYLGGLFVQGGIVLGILVAVVN